jgi:hypothetical protein
MFSERFTLCTSISIKFHLNSRLSTRVRRHGESSHLRPLDLRTNQHKRHSRRLGVADVPPRVQGAALHTDIAGLEAARGGAGDGELDCLFRGVSGCSELSIGKR